MGETNFVFKRGKLTTILDAQAGSSGKGVIGSYVCQHADNWQFACNTFMPQAGHWVKLDDGRSFFYQTLNSCAYNHDKFEKLYIGPGATIELPALWRELEENGLPRHKLGISPITSILQDIDAGYERGTHGWDGKPLADTVAGGPLASTGSTAHGCGANRARRVLRRREARYAKDIPELREFLCDVPSEVMERLRQGQSGLLEVAQGFQLSYMLQNMFPFTTSRNCTVAAGFDDMMVAPLHVGPVILNFRTYPIRINSNKYIDMASGKHLTWPEVLEAIKHIDPTLPAWDIVGQQPSAAGLATVGVNMVVGNSGPGYHDHEETNWEAITSTSGSREPITEITSVTKLPRRVFTFSRQNMHEAIRHNATGHDIYLSVNFVNYVDATLLGVRGNINSINDRLLTDKVRGWFLDNLRPYLGMLRFIGTGPRTDDKIVVNYGSQAIQNWKGYDPYSHFPFDPTIG